LEVFCLFLVHSFNLIIDNIILFSEIKIRRNNYITTIPVVKREYSLEINIRPSGKVAGWTTILRIASDATKGCCAEGNRIPTIFFQSNSNKVIICTAISGSGNKCYTSSDNLPNGKVTKIGIQQVHQYGTIYRYSISLNNKEVYQTTNTKAKEFKNAKLYIGDEFLKAAKANILKVKFQNTGNSSLFLLIFNAKIFEIKKLKLKFLFLDSVLLFMTASVFIYQFMNKIPKISVFAFLILFIKKKIFSSYYSYLFLFFFKVLFRCIFRT